MQQKGSWSIDQGLLWIGALLAGLLLLHLLATWLEARGWINYRKPGRTGYGVALSNAMAEFEAILNPAVEHHMEEVRFQDGTRRVVENSLDPDPNDEDIFPRPLGPLSPRDEV